MDNIWYQVIETLLQAGAEDDGDMVLSDDFTAGSLKKKSLTCTR